MAYMFVVCVRCVPVVIMCSVSASNSMSAHILIPSVRVHMSAWCMPLYVHIYVYVGCAYL